MEQPRECRARDEACRRCRGRGHVGSGSGAAVRRERERGEREGVCIEIKGPQ